jgi:hypothetical protein
MRRVLQAPDRRETTIIATRAMERDCSRSAKIWFGIMTAVFQVVDDRPPHEPLWTDAPRDSDDVPIWNAAVRSGAHFVVTSNLADGPPVDADGRRIFSGIACVSPEDFSAILAWWSTSSATGPLADSADDAEVPPVYRAFVHELRAQELTRLAARATQP